MVTNITSLSGNGVYDWLIQRVSALVLLAWIVFIVLYIAGADQLDYAQWSGLFSHLPMRVFTLAALVALCLHAWIGMWTISTDYLTPAMLAATVVRLLFQLACLAVLLVYFVWCIELLWSI